jgi:hypothetical protein
MSCSCYSRSVCLSTVCTLLLDKDRSWPVETALVGSNGLHGFALHEFRLVRRGNLMQASDSSGRLSALSEDPNPVQSALFLTLPAVQARIHHGLGLGPLSRVASSLRVVG